MFPSEIVKGFFAFTLLPLLIGGITIALVGCSSNPSMPPAGPQGEVTLVAERDGVKVYRVVDTFHMTKRIFYFSTPSERVLEREP